MDFLNFLSKEGNDFKGRTLDSIWSFSDEDIERTHDFIQILFPLNKQSESAFHGYYFSSYSPLWSRILYDIDENWTYDHTNYQIIFTSEGKKEIFENGFNLEHEEQPLEVQNLAIKSLNQCAFNNLLV